MLMRFIGGREDKERGARVSERDAASTPRVFAWRAASAQKAERCDGS